MGMHIAVGEEVDLEYLSDFERELNEVLQLADRIRWRWLPLWGSICDQRAYREACEAARQEGRENVVMSYFCKSFFTADKGKKY